MKANYRIIAAVRNFEEFEEALRSATATVFFLSPDIMDLPNIANQTHDVCKKLFIHIDLATGLGKDRAGLLYAKSVGVDGIISTRSNLIKLAHEIGLGTVQRLFALDSQSVGTAVENLRLPKADMIEIMPGVIPKIIRRLHERVDVPIIAGGFIETEAEIAEAIEHGAYAVSTGKKELWQLA